MWLIKLAMAVAAIAYTLSPLDLIPDIIPVIGILDDAGIDLAALLFCLFAGKKPTPQVTRRVVAVRRIR